MRNGSKGIVCPDNDLVFFTHRLWYEYGVGWVGWCGLGTWLGVGWVRGWVWVRGTGWVGGCGVGVGLCGVGVGLVVPGTGWCGVRWLGVVGGLVGWVRGTGWGVGWGVGLVVPTKPHPIWLAYWVGGWG